MEGGISHRGIVIFAHGSRIESANEAVRAVAEQVAGNGAPGQVRAAFLELGQPDLAGAVSDLAAGGVRHILVVPYFLTLGLHMHRDLPGIVEEAARIHEGVEIRIAPPLDGHPALAQIVLDRASDGFREWNPES